MKTNTLKVYTDETTAKPIGKLTIAEIIGREVTPQKLTPPVFGDVSERPVKHGSLGETLDKLSK